MPAAFVFHNPRIARRQLYPGRLSFTPFFQVGYEIVANPPAMTDHRVQRPFLCHIPLVKSDGSLGETLRVTGRATVVLVLSARKNPKFGTGGWT